MKIEIAGGEMFDEQTDLFIDVEPITVELNHSLVSISKWEAIHKRPFLPPVNVPYQTHPEMTQGEMISYIVCMVVGEVPSMATMLMLYRNHSREIKEMINQDQTATVVTFSGGKGQPHRGAVTSELIYYWMIEFGIPFECQHWHLSRLMSLIKVCSAKRSNEKMSTQDVYRQNAALNEARKRGGR